MVHRSAVERWVHWCRATSTGGPTHGNEHERPNGIERRRGVLLSEFTPVNSGCPSCIVSPCCCSLAHSFPFRVVQRRCLLCHHLCTTRCVLVLVLLRNTCSARQSPLGMAHLSAATALWQATSPFCGSSSVSGADITSFLAHVLKCSFAEVHISSPP
jgi:hypothetical protein